jgi:hypothetical protein
MQPGIGRQAIPPGAGAFVLVILRDLGHAFPAGAVSRHDNNLI